MVFMALTVQFIWFIWHSIETSLWNIGRLPSNLSAGFSNVLFIINSSTPLLLVEIVCWGSFSNRQTKSSLLSYDILDAPDVYQTFAIWFSSWYADPSNFRGRFLCCCPDMQAAKQPQPVEVPSHTINMHKWHKDIIVSLHEDHERILQQSTTIQQSHKSHFFTHLL